MRLPEFAVNRPITTLMIFFGILILGTVALYQLPIDVMPKIDIPTMGVITQYRGASAEDIETKVTKIIEDNVGTVPNLKHITSVSEEAMSAVTVMFEWGTNLDEAANELRQRLDLAKMRLPEDADDPILVKFDFSMMPVLFFGITATESYEDLYDIVDREFCDPIERLPGVAMTVIMGGLQREIQVNVDQQRLEAYGIPIERVTAVLAAENLTQPAGNLKIGQTHSILRVPGEYSSLEDIKDVIVAQVGGSPVYMRDVARVEDSFKDTENKVRIDRTSGLMVMVQKQSGANTVTVADRVREALPEIEARLPDDAKVVLAMDSSDFVRRSINNLSSTVWWALLFVMAVVFFFMRDWRGSLIVAFTIPFSIIIAFIFMFAGDYTINMMTLSALAIAIGMVVDNSIVIFENTYRHRADEGDSKREAAIFGSSEVGRAVTASTLTTVAIFFPIIFVGGLTGIMFRELALGVIVVLSASLFASLTLTPMLASRFMRVASEQAEGSRLWRGFHDRGERWFKALDGMYRDLLGWALSHRKIVVGVAALLFGLTLLLLRVVGTEFMPTMDRGQFMGTVELPVGTRLTVTDSVMMQIENIIEQKIPERELMFARCGKSETGMGAMMGRRSDVNIAMVGGRLVPKGDRSRSDADVAEALRREISRIPGIETIDFTVQDPFQSLTSGGAKPVSVEIYGYDFKQTDALAALIKTTMDGIPGLTDVTISRIPGAPELWIEIDREKASLLGLSVYSIANTISTDFSGKTATQYREGGNEYDILVQLAAEDRGDIADIEAVAVTAASGAQIPLRNVAEVVDRQGPVSIERKDQDRIVYVQAGLYGRSLGEVVTDMRKAFASIEIPPGIDVKIAGSAQDQAESFRVLLIALILGIVLVYMVMASQFESLIDPFIVMFSVPFAIVGATLALVITGRTLNIISYVGMIMLVGIVVNNAIVLVDYINIMRARGLGVREAILITGPRRLRPVLMTTFTTIFALFPLALRTGEGSEVWSPLAISVIGGLLVSTLVTMILVPTLYSVFEERLRGKRLFGRVGEK